MEFGILGPLEVSVAGQPLAIGRARTRAVLALLLVEANRVVPADTLAQLLWPHLTTDRAVANLQVRLSELRRALRSVGEGDRLQSRPPGYRLHVDEGELDALRFEGLVAAGRKALISGDAHGALASLETALGLWRGVPLVDIDGGTLASAERTRLEELHLDAQQARIDALLAAGRHQETLGELEALTGAHPLRERFWYQRLLALYRCGRQAEALRAYQQLRATLVDQIGIEPSPQLRELEAQILRQDPALLSGPVGRPGARGPRAPDSLRGQRRRAHRLSGRRRGSHRHPVRARPDQPYRTGLGRSGHRGLLHAARRHGPADPFRQTGHRPVRPHARRLLTRPAHRRRHGRDGRRGLPPGHRVRLLRRGAHGHSVGGRPTPTGSAP